MSSPDVIVIGAGIVGAACALELQARGRQVLLLDAAHPGAGVTAAGMGHLVALDETEDELDLCLLSLDRWERYLAEHGGTAEHLRCGTLWVAQDDAQLARAHARAHALAQRGWDASVVPAARLRKLEPALREGLAGGVEVSRDGVVYPPAVARDLVRQLLAQGGRTAFGAPVAGIDGQRVMLARGDALHAGEIVLAAGNGVSRLLPEMPVFPRKGHLAITDRYPGRLSRQVVDMGYGQATGADGLAVAANVQPRATGQWLIGSCRQDGVPQPDVDPAVLAQVLRAAIALLPCLVGMRIVRSWTGLRPATADGRPLIGAHPARPHLWLAAGHEGLGVTTAFGTARLLADLMLGQPAPIDAAPYSPSRFAHGQA